MTAVPTPQKFDLTVIGELNVDLLLYGKDLTPSFGQTEKLVKDAVLTVGSSSAIFAHQAALLGLRVAFVGKVGDDTFGEFMVSRLQNVGIDTSAIVVDCGVKTGVTLHLVRGEDRAMLTYPGSIAALHPREVDKDLLQNTRHLHAGSYFLQKGIQMELPDLFAHARQAGSTTSLDPGWDPEENWNSGLVATLRQTDIFLPNEQELLAITRQYSIQKALTDCTAPHTVVVKGGSSGAILYEHATTKRCAPPPVDSVDTTGAGDSFDAGFLFAQLNGYGTERALEIGCVCGALSTQSSGGVDAQPELEQIEQWISGNTEGNAQ